MTFISREEALAREDHRERVLRKYSAEGGAGAVVPIADLLDKAEASDMFRQASTFVRPSDAGRILDFLVTSEPQVYVPGTVALDPEETCKETLLTTSELITIADTRVLSSESFAWVNRLGTEAVKTLRDAVCSALLRWDMGPLDWLFQPHVNIGSVSKNRVQTMVTVLNAMSEDFSALDVPDHDAAVAVPLRVPVRISEVETARNSLRDAATRGDFTMSAMVLKNQLETCARAHRTQSARVQRAARLERIRYELELRRPIRDGLISRGVPKIIAKELTTVRRREHATPFPEDEASDIADGWNATKNLPAELVSALLGVPERVADVALRLEKLSAELARA